MYQSNLNSPYHHIMRKLDSFSLLTLLFLLLFTSNAIGQSRSSLEAERNRLIEQIEIADQQLANAESSTKSSLEELSALESQINSREELINNLKQQLDLGEKGLKNNSDSIQKMDLYMQNLNADFRRVMRLAHMKRRSQNWWLSIFSTSSLNEAILIFQYSNQFNKYLESKRGEINHLRMAIEHKNETISEEQNYTIKLLAAEKENFEKLEAAKSKKGKLLASLKKEEVRLRKERDEKRREREKLNTQIEKIILAELQKRKAKPTKTVSFSSKNTLQWPTDNGYISCKFGEQAHLTIKSLKINNNGIDISAKPNSTVKAVLAGTIVGVTKIPGYDIMVIIEHDEYYTVYSKLASAKFAKGDSIEKGQSLGQLGDSGKLHFEIWKGKQKLDPATLLKKQ